MRNTIRLGGLAILLATLVNGSAPAQVPTTGPEPAAGITVWGTGEARAKPNLVEIDMRSSGAAELAGDAIVKYRDNKRRIVAAFEALKLKNIEIVERGLSLTNSANAEQMQMMMRGMAAQGGKPQIEIARTLRLTLRDVQDTPEEKLMETISKVLDVAKDAGAVIGPSSNDAMMAYRYGNQMNTSMTTFVLDNLNELREQAYKKAVQDAKERAQRLASLTDVKLGQVLSVQEILVSGDEATGAGQVYAQYVYYYGSQPNATQTEPSGPRVASNTFNEIPVRVKLQVRFGIEK